VLALPLLSLLYNSIRGAIIVLNGRQPGLRQFL